MTMIDLKHPFPGEPFGGNAFAVLFGGEALRKRFDATWARGYVGDAVADELLVEMYELAAKHAGVTVDAVKAFLSVVHAPRRKGSAMSEIEGERATERDVLSGSPDQAMPASVEEVAPAAEAPPTPPGAATDASAERKGKLRNVGGSQSDQWNVDLARQVTEAVWTGGLDAETRARREDGAVEALIGSRPRNEIEAMLIAQLLAAHNASLECFRRGMLPNQDFQARIENLHLAGKLSRTSAILVEALAKHRGKGTQQRVTVRHIHVHSGGRAVVGVVGEEWGVMAKRKNNPMRSALPMHLSRRCLAQTRTGIPCQAAAMRGRFRCRMHGALAGAPKENANALKRGHHTSKAIAERRKFRALIRQAKKLVEMIEADA